MVDDEKQDQPEGVPSEEAPATSKQPKKKRSFWKELPILILVALVLTFVIQQFIARPYMIPSGSMESTLHGCPTCTPDRVLVDKVKYRFSDPKPGDVVVFRGPGPWTENDLSVDEPSNPVAGFFRYLGSMVGLAPPDERDFVKRIIALGGQTVMCCDEENRVVVDGKPLDEDPYLFFPAGSDGKQDSFAEITVPEGQMFMMGDNRKNSNDSRRQGGGGLRGMVPVDNIIGKAQFIVLPVQRWGGIDDHNPQGDGR